MPLPVLSTSHAASPVDLLRYFHKCVRELTQHYAEAEDLDCGTALFAPALPDVYDANRMYDAALPGGASPAGAVAQAEAFYAARGLACHKWVPNPAAPAAAVLPLVEHLTRDRRHVRAASDVMHLSGAPAAPVAMAGDLTIIPARAAFAQTRRLLDEYAAERGAAALAEAGMAHLDDPRWDALLALRGGTPVAHVGVLAVGEWGLIDEVFVSAPHRRRGVGRTMVARAVEICARSLFKHVFLNVGQDNAGAQALYAPFGFRKVGEFVEYVAPGASSARDG